MVMKKTISARRVGIAEAKARLSEVLRDVDEEPVVIHNRGRDVAVVVGVATYERLRAAEASAPSGMGKLIADIAELRDKYGGGADIAYERIDYAPRNPFRGRGK
jgi:prevent-host-death family protein